MQKIIKNVDEKQGIVQVTIADERWYLKMNGENVIKAVPSVTWIAGKYPKGVAFYKWLADKGWDETEAIKQAAGVKGSKVHLAITDVLMGNEVRIDSKYPNPKTGILEELTLEECDAILSFIKWKDEVKPESIAWDLTVFSDKYNYAGTIDYLCKIDSEIFVVDFKTSAQVWTEYELQVSAYKNVLIEENPGIPALGNTKDIKLMILQVGYKRNKNGYKENIIDDKFKLFLSARDIWANEHDGEQPNKRDYPIVLSPGIKPEDINFNK